MYKNRIRELRLSRNLQQVGLGNILGTSQQSISRMESGHYDIPTDLLVKMAKYFGVSTDYILGISETKRDFGLQVQITQELERYYDLILRYKGLTKVNKKTLQILLERLEQAQMEHYDDD